MCAVKTTKITEGGGLKTPQPPCSAVLESSLPPSQALRVSVGRDQTRACAGDLETSAKRERRLGTRQESSFTDVFVIKIFDYLLI